MAEAQHRAAVAHVASAEAAQRDLVNCWRELPLLLTGIDYEKACAERPFMFDGPEPAIPDPDRDRGEFLKSALERARREAPRRTGWHVSLILLAIVTFFFVSPGSPGGGFAASVGVLVTGWLLLFWVHKHGISKAVARMVQADWPTYLESLQVARAEYERLMAEWPDRERIRAQWARRLVSGDREALEQTVSESLEDLDFPFESECRVEVPDARSAFVLVDLPEIEDVIPETKQRALKNGTLKEVRRTKAERNQDYVQLVTGLALWITRTVFSSGPTLRSVRVAAYTQRRQRGTGQVADEFIYEVMFDRHEAERWVAASVEPLVELTGSTSRIDVRENGDLKKISPPEWADDALIESA